MMDDLNRALGRLEGKVDLLLERARDAEEGDKRLSERVTRLEHSATAQKATVGVIATVTAGASTVLAKLFGWT